MMDNDKTLAYSCASFDSQGQLLDWNEGFESEFSLAGSSIASGAYFRDILQRAYNEDHVIRVYLPNPNQPQDVQHYMERWPQDLGTTHTFKYWDQGRIVNVQESRTILRGVIRIAAEEVKDIPVPVEQNRKTDGTKARQNETVISANKEQDRLLRTAALETSHSILLLRLRTEQKLKSLSITDALTGLANRRHFSEILEAKWQRALQTKTSLGIIIADIDYFKQYNDHYGHSAGDTCLRQVAAALSESMRLGMDLVARYGGEEFAVILPGADHEAAQAAAERACNSVAALKEPHAHGMEGIVTVSIGVSAQVPVAGAEVQALIDRADAALYEAKNQGRNRVVCAPPE